MSGTAIGDCYATVESWFLWCSSCGRHGTYGQPYFEERHDPRSGSHTSSPYQSPVQATSSGTSGGERTALIPKATELNSTAPGNARPGEARGGKPPKWANSNEHNPALPPMRKEGIEGLATKGRNASGLSLAASEEGEFCSTCLEAYTQENPAIWTKCNHHFHLACIYEWMERKQTCPICEREMSFEEVLS